MLKLFKSTIIVLLAVGLWCPQNAGATSITTPGTTASTQQKKKITGVVTDSFGPVTGAAVMVKGTTNGTITDFDGNYSLDVDPGATLVISFMGYITQEIQVNEQTSINVFLLEDTQLLDEVVVTALGIKKESKKLGYAMSTISADELVKTGTPNFATSLYGKASGVRIQAAPGGSTSAVSINIRGLNSITGTNQPLIIVDGVPIRNGDANKDGFWDNQRVESNGLVDINPEDIADLSILKGASASALYGSEAANGVVLITTKTGQGRKGLGIDFNMTFGVDRVAYLPEYQNVFGPGGRPSVRSGEWETGNGFSKYTYKGEVYDRVEYESNQMFGPRFDGREVIYWDGSVRKYEPYKNGWKDIFRTGTSGSYNLSLVHGGENSNVRFSYTYADNRSVQHESNNDKHNFNLAGSFSPHKKLKIDYTGNYMRQSVHNRPYRMSQITNNFNGMITNFDDTKLYRQKTVTSLGYQNVHVGEENITPDEALLWKTGSYDIIDRYLWNSTQKIREETINRFISSVTATYQIIDGLSVRGRIATDLTSSKTEDKERSSKPLGFEPTGKYRIENYRYEIYYGDLLLMYDHNFNERWGINANVGYQGRKEQMYKTTLGTEGGLSVENWFHPNASTNVIKETKLGMQGFLKQAFFATAGVSFNNYLFLEGTARQEKSSTLAPDNNAFFYPSVNSSFLFTEAFHDKLPEWLDYGKIRASYGVVGNAPEIYKASFLYEQDNFSGFIYNKLPEELGNNYIRPEKKYEWEFGLEAKMLNNRLGFEVTYYTSKVKDQILPTTVSWSTGAKSILRNVGELENQGWEFSAYGTPVQTRNFKWDISANISFNNNKVKKLLDGIDELEHENYDGGAVRLVSRVGEKMGSFLAHVPKTNDEGLPVVGADGMYLMDRSEYKVVGNAMPDAVGGISTSLSYKNVFLDMSLDFRIGGDVLNTPYQYMMSRGSLIQSMQWRDAEHGGLTYYMEEYLVDPTNPETKKKRFIASSKPGPGGERLWDDGIILPGVKEDGTPNDIVVPAPDYYTNTYGWGTGNIYRDYSRSIFKNSYLKMRELSFGYTFPTKLLSKFQCNNLTVSVYGRNLFYFYKNLPSLDAEATDGTTWITQAQIGGSTATTRSFGISLRASF